MKSEKIGIDRVDGTQSSKIKYELNESEVLDLYYSEPRLATLMDLDVILLVDRHLVVNLKDFITPKTNHLTANAKRHISACCVGVQYIGEEAEKSHRGSISCTLDILIQSAAFLESSDPLAGEQSKAEQNKESALINREIDRLNKIINELPGSFSGSLKSHMERKGYTEELLAQESWVWRGRILHRLKNKRKGLHNSELQNLIIQTKILISMNPKSILLQMMSRKILRVLL